VKEPATLPFFTTMSDMIKTPVTLNAGNLGQMRIVTPQGL
jgi:hypothetical protein